MRIEVRNLPWSDTTVNATVTSLTGAVDGPHPVSVSAEGTLQLDIALAPQSVFLVELTV